MGSEPHPPPCGLAAACLCCTFDRDGAGTRLVAAGTKGLGSTTCYNLQWGLEAAELGASRQTISLDSTPSSPFRLTQPDLRHGIQHQCPPGLELPGSNTNTPDPHTWAPPSPRPQGSVLQQLLPTGLNAIRTVLSRTGEMHGSLRCHTRPRVLGSVSPVEVQGPRVVTITAADERAVVGD